MAYSQGIQWTPQPILTQLVLLVVSMASSNTESNSFLTSPVSTPPSLHTLVKQFVPCSCPQERIISSYLLLR